MGTFPVPSFLPQNPGFIDSLAFSRPCSGRGTSPTSFERDIQGPLCGSECHVSDLAHVMISGSWNQARPLFLHSACCLLVPLLLPQIPLTHRFCSHSLSNKIFFLKNQGIYKGRIERDPSIPTPWRSSPITTLHKDHPDLLLHLNLSSAVSYFARDNKQTFIERLRFRSKHEFLLHFVSHPL